MNILTILFVSFATSCDRQIGNCPPPDFYDLFLSFSDEEENDLVTKLPYGGDKLEWGEGFYALKGFYGMNLIELEDCKDLYVSSLGVAMGSDNEYLWLSANCFAHSLSERPLELTYHLSCPRVFGNDADHLIVTQWRREFVTYGQVYCTFFSLDGKEYPVDNSDRLNNHRALVNFIDINL